MAFPTNPTNNQIYVKFGKQFIYNASLGVWLVYYAEQNLTTFDIDDLSDVDTTSTVPTDGQALVWDDANNKWIPGNVATGDSGITWTSSTTSPENPTVGDRWYNTTTDVLYEYRTDGTTSFWIDISTTDITGNATSTTIYGATIAGNLIPNTDVTYDLGSENYRFRDLYLSGSTIDLGGSILTTDASTGVIALIGKVTESNPNPTALIITGEGKTSSISTVGGQVDFELVQSSLESNPGFGGRTGDLADVDLSVTPETLTISADAPMSGSGMHWLWSWPAGTTAYSRLKITNLVQSNIPLYKRGTYLVYNFAAHELHGDMTQTHKLWLKWIDGAGTQNNVSWAVSTLNVTGISNPAINNGDPTEVQRLLINVPETTTLPTLTAPTVTFNVSAEPGAFVFSGNAYGSNPTLSPLHRGGTYTFTLDANVSGHPFYFTTDNGTNYVSGTYVGEYTDGVTGSRNDSGSVTFTIPENAPDTLYYQCGVHSAMRGTITIRDLAVEVNEAGNYVLYFQHDQLNHKTPVEIKPVPSIDTVGQVCLVFNNSTGKFEPRDLGQYLDSTSQFQSKLEDLITTTTVDKVTSSEVTSQIKDENVMAINMHQNGELAVTTGTKRWYAPFDLNIVDIKSRLGTAGDSTITVNIKKNDQVVKTYSFSANSTTATISSPTFSMTEDDHITVDVTSVGTSAKGEDLYIQFKYKSV